MSKIEDAAPCWCSPADEYLFAQHHCRLVSVLSTDTETNTNSPLAELTDCLGVLTITSQALCFHPDHQLHVIWRLPLAKVATLSKTVADDTDAHETPGLSVETTDLIRICTHPLQPYHHHNESITLQLTDFKDTELDQILDLAQKLQALAHQTDKGGARQRAEAAAGEQTLIRQHVEAQEFNTEAVFKGLEPGKTLGSRTRSAGNEKVLMYSPACRVTPLTSVYGWAVVTPARVCFAPFSFLDTQKEAEGSRCRSLTNLSEISYIGRRKVELEDVALEIISTNTTQQQPGTARNRTSDTCSTSISAAGTSLYLMFPSAAQRDRFHRVLLKQRSVLSSLDTRPLKQWTKDWVAGKVSNFDYLLHLNRAAGRSFNDLSQYPIFPWVLSDYTNGSLDLTDSSIYRDLSRPIAALSESRLEHGRTTYESLLAQTRGEGRGSFLNEPPWMWGSHYSNPGGIVFYLVRSHPQWMLKLQGGRFDTADRIFFSIGDAWKSVLCWGSDVKELIPEFFDPGQSNFLVKPADVDLGTRQDGRSIGDVELPPWAEGSAAQFVAIHRAALESDHVSRRLQLWIDLVFGVKSRGQGAEDADNVFFYTTYDEIVSDLIKKESDPAVLQAYRAQVREYGRTPVQLFRKKHPRRKLNHPQGLKRLFLACMCGAPGPISTTVSISSAAQVQRVNNGAVGIENGSGLEIQEQPTEDAVALEDQQRPSSVNPTPAVAAAAGPLGLRMETPEADYTSADEGNAVSPEDLIQADTVPAKQNGSTCGVFLQASFLEGAGEEISTGIAGAM